MKNTNCNTLSKDMIFHFVGIGGMGLSGIAELLISKGYHIQGSDILKSKDTKRITNLGIKVFIGHIESNVYNASCLIISNAIDTNNPELQYAKRNNIPILNRKTVLALLLKEKYVISVSGSHGKTSITAMLHQALKNANVKHTAIVGGIMNENNSNIYIDGEDLVLLESDESDATMVYIDHNITVLSNIDEDHIEYYGSFDNLMKHFQMFVNNTPNDGYIIASTDCPNVLKILSNYTGSAKIITTGLLGYPDISATDIEYNLDGSRFTLVKEKVKIENIFIPDLYVEYAVRNALIALAVLFVFKDIQTDIHVSNMLNNFPGVDRRLTNLGKKNDITIIDDYAHHPTEIKLTIDSIYRVFPKESKLIIVVEPHRYTRLKDQFYNFVSVLQNADHVILMELFAASETEIAEYNSAMLYNAIINDKYMSIDLLKDNSELLPIVKRVAKAGDVLLFLGAGKCSKLAKDFMKI